jgi:acyl-CoA thioester hydrolase
MKPSNAISIQRRLQWLDTDAAGVWHHSVAIRWAEEAEAELHRQLGIVDETFGATPRVRVAFDFSGALVFDDLVDITLTVTKLGETSITYVIEVVHGQELIASGTMVAVFIDRESGLKRRWPDHLRQVLGMEP